MQNNLKQSSNRMSRIAAQTLRKPRASKLDKSLSGSVLSQAKRRQMWFLSDLKKDQIFFLSDFQ